MSMDDLRYTISRCPLIEQWYSGERANNPCSPIISVQSAAQKALNGTLPPKQALDYHQLPEPWMGHIDKAPILFYSSNPAIIDTGNQPNTYWSRLDDRQQADSIRRQDHDNAFDPDGWITGGTHMGDSIYVPYWGWCKDRAKELLQRDVVPGVDYALTEIVHCKSTMGAGLTGNVVNECVHR